MAIVILERFWSHVNKSFPVKEFCHRLISNAAIVLCMNEMSQLFSESYLCIPPFLLQSREVPVNRFVLYEIKFFVRVFVSVLLVFISKQTMTGGRCQAFFSVTCFRGVWKQKTCSKSLKSSQACLMRINSLPFLAKSCQSFFFSLTISINVRNPLFWPDGGLWFCNWRIRHLQTRWNVYPCIMTAPDCLHGCLIFWTNDLFIMYVN